MSVIHASGRASKTEPLPHLNPPTPAADHLTPKQRKSLFALQIWNVEHKPSFARSSIYGYAR